jgi:hypothetical protein
MTYLRGLDGRDDTGWENVAPLLGIKFDSNVRN